MIIPTISIALIVTLGIIISTDTAYAQTITVNQTTPCFLNYNFTNATEIWDDCGMDEDYLQAALIGFEWVTGGYFSMILAGIFILFTYIKYHKAIYPIIIGVSFIPISFFLFPDTFTQFILIAVIVTLLAALYKIVKKYTSDFT